MSMRYTRWLKSAREQCCFVRDHCNPRDSLNGHLITAYHTGAKTVVDGHGGKIWVESEGAGKGSRFVAEFGVGRGV